MAVDVFISHHTASSLALVRQICGRLETKGLKCWYAPRDTRQFYAHDISGAVREAKVFVLMLNEESSCSKDVLNEVELAFQRVRADENIFIVPFQMDASCKISGDAKYYISRIHWMDAMTPPIEDRIEELCDRVQLLMEKGRSAETGNVYREGMQKLRPSNILDNRLFVGREEILNRLHDAMIRYGKVFLEGIGGIGKSQIVRQYIRSRKNEYGSVLFMTFCNTLMDTINNADVISGFERMPDEEPRSCFLRKLKLLKSLSGERTLIVVDNFDVDMDGDLELFLDAEYSVIFTTRNNHEDIGLCTIRVEALSEQEQMAFFRDIYRIPMRAGEEECVLKILKYIQGHTLTIELIARLMHVMHKRPAAMLEELHRIGIAAALSRGSVRHGFQMDVAFTFIRHLFDLSALGESEKRIMRNLTLAPAGGIDFQLFVELCGLDDGIPLDELIRQSWVIYDDCEDTVMLHPLIAEVVSAESGSEMEKYGDYLNRLISRLDHFQYRTMEYREIVRYSSLLAAVYAQCSEIDVRFSKAYDTMMDVFIHVGQNELALKLGEALLRAKTEKFSEESCEVGITCYFLGDLIRNPYCAAHDFGLSMRYMERSARAFKAAAPDSLDYAFVLKQYALRLLQNENEVLEEVKVRTLLAECGRVLRVTDEDEGALVNHRHSLIGSLYHTYALLCRRTGEYEKAIEYGMKCFDAFRDSPYAEDRPWSMSPLGFMSVVYSEMNRSDEAIDCAERAVRIAQEHYHEAHYRTLQQWYNLADVYGNLKRYESRFEVLKRIRELIEESSSPDVDMHKRVLEDIADCKTILTQL